MSELPYIVASTPIGKSVVVEVIRQGKKNTFQLKVGELKEESKPPAVSEAKPNLGLTLKEITPELAKNFRLSETTGLVVAQVEANSSAAEAGLAPGDIILEVDQEPLKSLGEFNKKITSYGAGDTVLLLINRRGTSLYLTLKIWE
jgi:serine protease Do